MNKRATRSWVLAGLIGLIAGFLLVDRSPTSPVSDNDTWLNYERALGMQSSSVAFGKSIIESGLIALPEIKTQTSAGAAGETPKSKIPAFPNIVGTSDVDGIPQVHLQSGDDRPITAVEGDILESGWQLVSVNLSGVTARYGDEERQIAMTDYDLAQNDKDESTDTGPKE